MAILDWTGISQPFRIENGSVAKSKSVLNSKYGDSPHIEESIRLIIRTQVGEWLTRGYIGSEFRSIVFSLFSDDFDTYIETKLVQAIEAQDKRVKITELTIERYPDENLIKVVVKWDINPEIVQNYINESGDYVTEVEIPNNESEDVSEID